MKYRVRHASFGSTSQTTQAYNDRLEAIAACKLIRSLGMNAWIIPERVDSARLRFIRNELKRNRR
jgi:hypothetical protein